MPESDMRPSPIADTDSPPLPSFRCATVPVFAMSVSSVCASIPRFGPTRIAGQPRLPSAMPRLTDLTRYADAQRHYSPERLWELFDGDRTRLNITHECVDRWAG